MTAPTPHLADECTPGAPVTTCDCPRAGHVHGEQVSYTRHRCRGEACRAARRAAEAHRYRMKAYGRYDMTDAGPVREHVRSLMSQGMGWERVADAAGVQKSAVGSILYPRYSPGHPGYRPPRVQVRRDTAEKILAVRLDLADGALIPATGTRRRLQALVLIGYSMSSLERRLGLADGHVSRMCTGQLRLVEVRTHERVSDLFGQLWDTPPTDQAKHVTSRAINMARKQGWAPAAAWDDIDRDERPADYQRHGVTVLEASLRRVDELEELAELGETWTDLTAARAGYSGTAAAASALRRHGREHVLRRFIRNTEEWEAAS